MIYKITTERLNIIMDFIQTDVIIFERNGKTFANNNEIYLYEIINNMKSIGYDV